MRFTSRDLVLSLAILLLVLGTPCSSSFLKTENKIKTSVFLSPKFELGAGSVINRYFYDVDFPRGHVAIKGFTSEVVDEDGNPIPLHETYLHHWAIARYHQPKNVTHKGYNSHRKLQDQPDDFFMMRNSGICQGNELGQYFGLGSETRGTATDIPDPFGIEIGNPTDIPEGHEEKWVVNVHAIDTREVEDKLGCTECKCGLYNVSKDEFGRPINSNYKGGLLCCYDYTQCKLRKGLEFVEGLKRNLYLKYTVKWVDWDDFVVPVKIYIIDVTDTLKPSDSSTGLSLEHDCKVEYEVESCSRENKDDNSCVDVKRTSLPMQTGGYVVYGVAHQHAGGIGSTLYGQDGRVICSSLPSYGNGNEAGNEAGYIVGMSTCYPEPGTVKISDGETLTLESNYNSSREHIGVMGLFHVLVAEQLPQQHLRQYSTRSSFFMDIKNLFF